MLVAGPIWVPFRCVRVTSVLTVSATVLPTPKGLQHKLCKLRHLPYLYSSPSCQILLFPRTSLDFSSFEKGVIGSGRLVGIDTLALAVASLSIYGAGLSTYDFVETVFRRSDCSRMRRYVIARPHAMARGSRGRKMPVCLRGRHQACSPAVIPRKNRGMTTSSQSL